MDRARAQALLERLLLEIPDNPDEPQSVRFRKISMAMGGQRTMRQVASRVQKYFIRLAKENKPIPGRMHSNFQVTNLATWLQATQTMRRLTAEPATAMLVNAPQFYTRRRDRTSDGTGSTRTAPAAGAPRAATRSKKSRRDRDRKRRRSGTSERAGPDGAAAGAGAGAGASSGNDESDDADADADDDDDEADDEDDLGDVQSVGGMLNAGARTRRIGSSVDRLVHVGFKVSVCRWAAPGDGSVAMRALTARVAQGCLVAAQCDACGVEPIVGVRWTCVDCPAATQIDLCDRCDRATFQTAIHNPTLHQFVPMLQVEAVYDGEGDDYGATMGEYSYLDPVRGRWAARAERVAPSAECVGGC